MSDGTKIEWAANADGSPGATWNPIRARNRATGQYGWFCVHKSDGCKLCYAERINARLGTGVDYKAQNLDQVEIVIDENTITQPLRWRKPRTIFVCSMTDLFAAFVPDFMIDQVFAIAALCPQHTFIILTKRAYRMRAYATSPIVRSCVRDMAERLGPHPAATFCDPTTGAVPWPLPNVWLGISAETQREAEARVPDLLATPAAVRHVSLEPLLGSIDLSRYLHPRSAPHADGYGGHEGPGWTTDFAQLDWVIVGGESGKGARPMCAQWARDLRDQCFAAGVPFFFKQWGEFAPTKVFEPHDILVRAEDGACGAPGTIHGVGIWPMLRVGKRTAGRLLDGLEHNARPPLAHVGGLL